MKKAKKVSGSIPDYIAGFPPPTAKLLKQLRALIKKNAPKVEEKIAYGMPAYDLNGPLVYFAGYGGHVGFYPTPSAIIKFKSELADFDTSKGCVRLQLDEKLPKALIAKMVKFRVKENAASNKKKKA